MNSKKQLLVTGGLGYIGSHTVIELQQAGYEVFIIDDLSNSDFEVLDVIEQLTGERPFFEKLDLKDENKLDELFGKHDFAGVIHFAAAKSVGESVTDPLKYYNNNVAGLLNLVGVMLKHHVLNIVFSSSCTVYGQPDKLPVTEQTPVKPAESPYGNSKKICEDVLNDVCVASNELNAISLRYFNPVGAHPSGKIGEKPRGIPNNLMPYLLEVVSGEREILSVFGSDYDTRDGSAVRDYIHVVDLAQAHVIAVNRQMDEEQKNNYEYFNLGSGNGYTVLEVIHAFERVNEIKVNHKITERRPGDIEKIYADNSYAASELGWTPKLGLEEMMASAWKFKSGLADK